ncbi:unnamed protein product [Rotaria sordida]|uniref:NADP-dependent oxidoreductase domain-containing protein n=1 Tax=Rotaria sordida TaxID=392033 RepID=A0A819SIT2_9BILA|nr:unnamed protein product [Rotaria sordida]CAF4063567.1 unnamed protein product [Rotaria sordida]
MYVLPTRELNDGNRIPINGLRLFQADVYIGTINLVKLATREGYRLFDTAQLYENEFKTGQDRFNQQRSIVDYCRQYEICLMCYSSLARRQSLLHPFVIELPRKYQRKPAQILFR